MLLARQAPRVASSSSALLSWCWRGRPRVGGNAAAASAPRPPAVAPAQPAERAFTTRDYPQEPRVGVGVVVFRRRTSPSPEILLIRRAKAPCKGEWCFAGGSLELGETVAQCAAREVAEETGVRLVGAAGAAAIANLSDAARSDPDLGVGRDADGDAQLDRPVPFAVVDSIVYDDGGDAGADGGGGGGGGSGGGSGDGAAKPKRRQPQFHFAIVEVAAVAEDGDAPLAPSDDADDARWFALDELRALDGLTRGCAALAEQAARRFRVREG
jgi:ADP-ribose pyrophosphatase YjhB (NUDIX family)